MIEVTQIERFATHDGPGIRTTVFFKGCPLHCPWCANPETWRKGPELMHDGRKCVSCQRCSLLCPQHAISFGPDWTIDRSRCQSCGTCIQGCLPDALTMSGMMMSEEDIVKECLKDAAYYRNGGGVTLSGGDVFFQDPHRLLKLLKEAGLHVAVENEGNVSLDRLQTYAPYIDLFLMDLKHCDADIYEKVTGGDLSRVLDNLAWIHAHCPEKLVLRIPVIPNFNEECLDEILNLASNYAKEVHLLPFHPLGKEKWRRLGRNYAYASMPLMDKSHLEAWIQKGADKGLSVSIGG